MAKEIWFRSSEGVELCCEPDSVAAKLMSRDPKFVRIAEPSGDELDKDEQVPDSIMVDLSFMSEQEQIELARTILGLKTKDSEQPLDPEKK